MTHRPDSLDHSLQEFKSELYHCIDLIIERYRTMYEADGHPGNPEDVVYGWFDESLPERGMNVDALLDFVGDKVIAHPTMNIATRMFAYVMSGGTQVSVMADLLVSALDQNVAKWHLAPSMTEIERRVIAWTAEFMGLDPGSGGAIVSGGSAANLTGLMVARNLFAEECDVRSRGLFAMAPLITYASTQTHASVDKSIEALGLGSDNLRKIPTRADCTIDLAALVRQIADDRRDGYMPFCIIGNAGTVNTGAIDPLARLGEIARAEKLWFHVDGAYGGLAASLAQLRDHYTGIAGADSIALDYHKWLYQPFEIGCTMVRDWRALERTFNKSAEYLDYGAGATRFDISKHHFALSRNAKALKVWMSFKAYGAERLRAMIGKDIDCAGYLADLIDASEDFELVTRSALAIVCFRYCGNEPLSEPALDGINARLLAALEVDGRVFITGTTLNGHQVIRACIINHRIERADMDYLLDTVRDVATRECGIR